MQVGVPVTERSVTLESYLEVMGASWFPQQEVRGHMWVGMESRTWRPVKPLGILTFCVLLVLSMPRVLTWLPNLPAL